MKEVPFRGRCSVVLEALPWESPSLHWQFGKGGRKFYLSLFILCKILSVFKD